MDNYFSPTDLLQLIRVTSLVFYYSAMSALDTMYCAQQINIPPELPDILKNFTKAAIRTQPKDVLLWSAA